MSTGGYKNTAAERLSKVLEITFCGLHHLTGKIYKYYEGTDYERWEYNHWGDLSTFDFNTLTALVIAAHDQCVRVSIQSSGPKMVKIVLFPRFTRKGCNTQRHPTIDEAISYMRRYHVELNCEEE